MIHVEQDTLLKLLQSTQLYKCYSELKTLIHLTLWKTGISASLMSHLAWNLHVALVGKRRGEGEVSQCWIASITFGFVAASCKKSPVF